VTTARFWISSHRAVHLAHGGDRSSGITSAAVRDFLDDAMERVTAEHVRQ
jgi:hypothetical protein